MKKLFGNILKWTLPVIFKCYDQTIPTGKEEAYTHLDQEMMQATADDLADVFKKVDTAARKKQMQRLASKVLWFPKTGS